MEHRGAYTADRAAALSGVPKSTLHYWSRADILVPSISPEKVKLWSYPDLMGLRTISWLRQTKRAPDGAHVPRSTMPAVRRALGLLRELDLSLWTENSGPAVAVDRSGNVHVVTGDATIDARGWSPLDSDMLNLLAPYAAGPLICGPDLKEPRPLLRIVPGKLAGSPHVKDSRIETQALAALARRDLPAAKIYQLYPGLPANAVEQAVDLERQLSANLAAAA